MAFVDQSKKSRIAANLKKVVPKGWKYSLAVRNHSTIVMTIASAPFELIKAFEGNAYIKDESVGEVFAKIFEALNTDNYDRSDSQTDYFDCGHYVDLNLGRWDKPFVCTAQVIEEVAA